MNTDTGAIAYFENAADAKAAGHTDLLALKESKQLLGVNRHERRAALAEMRKEKKK